MLVHHQCTFRHHCTLLLLAASVHVLYRRTRHGRLRRKDERPEWLCFCSFHSLLKGPPPLPPLRSNKRFPAPRPPHLPREDACGVRGAEHICAYMRAYMHICGHLCIYARVTASHMYIRAHICVYVRIRVYTYMCTSMHICTDICICSCCCCCESFKDYQNLNASLR